MSIKFEKHPYIEIVKEDWELNSENKIIDYAINHQQFTYGNVNFQKFTDKYIVEGWFGRKIIALPPIVLGTVKAVYHLAEAILGGLIIHSSDTKYLKSKLFCVARDLQESFGWLATLFSDKYGQYHVQESRFHKLCYDCFLKGNISDTKTKETLLAQMAESYFSEGNLEKALKTIDKLDIDTKTKEAFIVKVANAYIKRGERDKAIGAISKLYRNINEKFALLIQIAQSYFSEDDEAGVFKAIQEIAETSLINKLAQRRQHVIYFVIMMNDTGNNIINNFFSGLAKDCFAQAQVYFIQNNAQAILEEIIRKSTEPLTIQSFLNLKSGQPHRRNKFSRNGTSSNQRYSRAKYKTRRRPSSLKASYYSILKLQPTASKKDIRKAYMTLARKYHPDRVKRNQNESEIELERRKQIYQEKFKLISQAYEMLYKH